MSFWNGGETSDGSLLLEFYFEPHASPFPLAGVLLGLGFTYLGNSRFKLRFSDFTEICCLVFYALGPQHYLRPWLLRLQCRDQAMPTSRQFAPVCYFEGTNTRRRFIGCG